ncbi:ABC transporter permease [Cohnella zeiphila]|uniref:ABC transporter permease n=1 Tax=Cohnella zeiphila TaxID=2761120 RepID=A0A7X0SMC8_9BACL|nr:ABC transporter permease [Cohnella zeiphila]MBB6732544.1 ABC transporter permease [Cohnella zeiphila]
MAEPVRSRSSELRKQRADRASAFRGEMVPYFRYVLQSGFGLVLSACAFFLVTGYIRLLDRMPDHWPADVVGVAVLALACWYTPLRTYFQPADTVFTVPLEREMLATVIGPQVRRSYIVSAVKMLVLFAAFAPLYATAPVTAAAADGRSLTLLGLALALLGAWNAFAAWQERRLADAAWRTGLAWARRLLVIPIVWALLLKPFILAVGFALLCAAALTLPVRLQIRHELPWDRLIAEEGSTRRGWIRFLGWFVDVPSAAARPSKRRWIVWAADLLPRRQASAWRYLYAKTLLRSESFGAFWRWNALLIVILLWTGQPIIDLIAYAMAVFVGSLQLTELGRIRFAENASAVPLDPQGRRPAAAAVARTAGLTAVLLLWLAAALPARPFDTATWLIALAAGLLWAGWLIPRRLGKAPADEDDD